MLQGIRDKTHGWIAGIIISLLVLSFALWGIHSYMEGAGNNNVAAKVNGVEISKNQVAAAYERLRRQTLAQLNPGAQLPVRIENGLRQRALQTLIDIQVLSQASTAADYRISLNQVDAFLQHLPEFQVKGQFSLERFQQLLTANMFSIADFMGLMEATLLIDQPRLGIMLTSFALPNEVDDTIALLGQERDIRYLLIPASYFSHQTIAVNDQDIRAYYAQHQDEFKTIEQASVDYILLSIKDLAEKVHPTEEQLKAFYKDNFASSPYDKVKDRVKAAYIQQKAEEMFADLREKLATLTYEHPESLQTAAQTLNLPVNSTEMFSRDKGGKDLSANAKIRDAAFSNDVLELKNNSDVVQVDPTSVAVVRVKKYIPATILPLSTVQTQIIEKLRAQAVNEKMQQLAQQIQEKLQAGSLTTEQAAQQYHLEWNNAGFVSRRAKNVDPAILLSAFDMPKPTSAGKMTYAIAKGVNNYAVIALTAVKAGAAVPKNQEQIFAEQVQNAQAALEYDLYKASIMRKAKIVVEMYTSH